MLWGVTTILAGLIVGAWAGEGVEGREGRSITWAEVANNEEKEYDDSFFRNDDYVYVDADEVDLPPPPEYDTPHKLERRTLGYILGSLVDGGTEDPRPQRSSGISIQPATPPPSSFLESVMRSIDNFVVQDLKGWSKFLTAMNDRTTTPAPPTTTPRPSAIQPTQDEELVVIMDEFGRPQVVTVNDIVASLSQLDEQTITELLLGPTNPGLAPKSAPAPAKNQVQSDFLNAITGSLNRLPEHSQARTSHSPTTISPIKSQTTAPKLSPSHRPSVGPTNRPNIITSISPPKISSIINSTPKSINSTPKPFISSTPSPPPFISQPSKRPSIPSSPQGPAKRPTSFPNISSIPSPTKTPTKTPIDVPNIGAILGPTINSPRGPTQTSTHGATHGPTQISSRGSTQISTHGPTRNPTHGPTQSSSRGSTQISTHGPTRNPTHGPTQSSSRSSTQISTHGLTRNPTHGPIQSSSRGSTHISTHGPTQSSSRGSSQSFSRGPTHTIIRGTSTRGTTHTAVRGTPTRTLAQSFAQGIPTRSHTNGPTRGPTHRPSHISTHGPTHISFNDPTRGPTGPFHSGQVVTREGSSIIRATPIHIPTGVPTRNPGRPDILPPDFLLPSASRNNAVKQSSSDSVARPVRHTGPSHGAPPKEEEGEEVILIRDETGAVHMHTIQDIISSLAALSPENAQDLLFGEAPAQPPATLNLLQETQAAGSAEKSASPGGVHKAPRPRRPTSVQDVIAAAEAAEEPQLPHSMHAVSSGEQQNPSVPTPVPTTPRPSLMDALRQQDIPESIVQHLAAPSILRPVTQATPVEQTTPGGIGATLRGMLSRFVVGQPQQQQQQQTQPQQSHAVVGQLGLALPKPIHHKEAAPASPPNTLQATTKRSSEGATLPPALQHLSPAVQAALRQQADNVPTFVPPGTQHAAARSDAGPVEYIDEDHVEAPPTPPPTPAPSPAPPLVLPPAVLKQLPPSVLNKVTKQYIEARVGGAPEPAQDRDYYQPVAHYYDYEVHPPVVQYPVHPPVHHHYEHSYDHGYDDYGALAPMLDIFLLADVTKVHKVGDTNLSFKAPKIGDPSYFVDTRAHEDHY
ncbi:mucin-5AC-like [Eriocheir sinensis]|uniref:mucin-5AC-like n=1 Tax=Eriocheir sinensis TaxID=95602 RepID=UPI0021C567F1|nr:mucin-5AC-like [Eriocheir sinensis]